MAVTQNTYTGDGSTVLYNFTFPYLATTDIKVKLDGVDTTAYTLANATTVQMNSAPASAAKIIIYRNTDNDNKKATFYPGSAIKAEDLNNNYDQILYTVQEVDNNSMSTLGDTAMQGDMLIGQGFGLQFEGTTPDDFETRLIAEDPTADRVITMPDATGTMVLASDTGKVGIGTTNPGNLLDISGDAHSKILIETTGTANAAGIQIKHASGNAAEQTWQIQTDGSADGDLKLRNATDDTDVVFVKTDGKVGIGDTSPDRKLHVNSGATNECAIFESSDTEVTLEFKDTTGTASLNCRDDFRLNNSSGELIRIDSSGNVGINTTSPETLLDVYGDGANGELTVQRSDGASILTQAQSGQGQFGTNSDHNLQLIANSTGYITLKTDGKVGIGESNPDAKLVVYRETVNSANPILEVRSNHDTTDSIKFSVDGDGEAYFSDRVGIGTTSPDTLLHLAGEDTAVIRLENTDTSLAETTDTQIIGGIEFEKQDPSGAGVGVVGGLKMYAGPGGGTSFLSLSTADATANNVERVRITSDGSLIIDTGNAEQQLREFTSETDSDISGLFPSGSNFGTLHEVSPNGNHVLALRENDNTDSFAIISGGGNYNSDSVYDKVITRFQADGKVLIGTTISNTSDRFTIVDPGDVFMSLRSDTAADNTSQVFDFAVGTDDRTSSNVVSSITSTIPDGSTAGGTLKGDLTFSTNGGDNLVERLKITSDGNLELPDNGELRLGTGPDLQIYHNGTSSFIDNNTGDLNIRNNVDNDDGGNIHIQARSGEDSIKCNDDGATELYYDGILKLSTSSHGASIQGGLTTNGAYDFFTSSNAGGYSNLTLKKSDSDGDDDDFLQCRSSGSSSDIPPGNLAKLIIAGDGDVTNANNSYGSISDSKLKENIVDANSQWNDLKAIKVRNFNFKTDSSTKLLGVVAQEVETISPALVSESIDRDSETNEDLGTKTKSVKYSVLYMKAVKALQEAMTRIETLEAKVAALESA